MANMGKPTEYKTARSLEYLAYLYRQEGVPSFWFKIPDTYDARKKALSHDIIQPQVPGDFIFVNPRKSHLIECKSSTNKLYYDLRYIKSHQIESLIQAHNAGWDSHLLFHAKHKNLKKAWIMGIDDYLDMTGSMTSASYLKWALICEYGFCIESLPQTHEGVRMSGVKGSVWDFKGVF